MSVIAPVNFNGELFIKKFQVKPEDFSMYKGELFCEKLPDLTEDDIADCVDFEGMTESAILSFIEKWGSLNTYPDGNDAQQDMYLVCEQLEQRGLLIRSSKRTVGMVIFLKSN